MSLAELKKIYRERRGVIQNRLEDFKKVKGDHVFYELCFCILTPQSNALKCDRCISILKGNGFLNKDFEIEGHLRSHTRFYRNKSKYLRLAKESYRLTEGEIKKTKNPKELREYLVKNVKGIGYKESSHFLRNIGYRNLAILDRHILKNLLKLNVIPAMPKTLTKKTYLAIEKKFLNFSKKLKIPMDELDLLFWSIETGKVFK